MLNERALQELHAGRNEQQMRYGQGELRDDDDDDGDEGGGGGKDSDSTYLKELLRGLNVSLCGLPGIVPSDLYLCL